MSFSNTANKYFQFMREPEVAFAAPLSFRPTTASAVKVEHEIIEVTDVKVIVS